MIRRFLCCANIAIPRNASDGSAQLKTAMGESKMCSGFPTIAAMLEVFATVTVKA